MLPSTVERVAKHTHRAANLEIEENTRRSLHSCARAGDPAIDSRLEELDREWDIERTLETNGSVLLLTGLALGRFVDKRFFALPALVGAFCLQHALQGWCPPIEAFRRLGVRTSREIERERNALKALRGDYDHVPSGANKRRNVNAALEAASR